MTWPAATARLRRRRQRREAIIGPRATRLLYRYVGAACLGLAALDGLLPLTPTTVFVLLTGAGLIAAAAYVLTRPNGPGPAPGGEGVQR